MEEEDLGRQGLTENKNMEVTHKELCSRVEEVNQLLDLYLVEEQKAVGEDRAKIAEVIKNLRFMKLNMEQLLYPK